MKWVCFSSGFSLLTVYLVGGFLYQRLVVGAKGMEQFPNYAFWAEVGNLAAVRSDQRIPSWIVSFCDHLSSSHRSGRLWLCVSLEESRGSPGIQRRFFRTFGGRPRGARWPLATNVTSTMRLKASQRDCFFTVYMKSLLATYCFQSSFSCTDSR